MTKKTATQQNDLITFEVGKTYSCLPESWSMQYTVVKRTAKTVTVKPRDEWVDAHNTNPRLFRVKIAGYGERKYETFKPEGHYSGAPIVCSYSCVGRISTSESKAPKVQKPQPETEKKEITFEEAMAKIKEATTENLMFVLQKIDTAQIIKLFNYRFLGLALRSLPNDYPRKKAINDFMQFELLKRERENFNSLDIEERIKKLATLDSDNIHYYLKEICWDSTLEEIADVFGIEWRYNHHLVEDIECYIANHNTKQPEPEHTQEIYNDEDDVHPTVAQYRQQAKFLGIKGYSKMKKLPLKLAVQDYIFDNFTTIMKGKKVHLPHRPDDDWEFVSGILGVMRNAYLRDLIRYFKVKVSNDTPRDILRQLVYVVIYKINKTTEPQPEVIDVEARDITETQPAITAPALPAHVEDKPAPAPKPRNFKPAKPQLTREAIDQCTSHDEIVDFLSNFKKSEISSFMASIGIHLGVMGTARLPVKLPKLISYCAAKILQKRNAPQQPTTPSTPKSKVYYTTPAPAVKADNHGQLMFVFDEKVQCPQHEVITPSKKRAPAPARRGKKRGHRHSVKVKAL